MRFAAQMERGCVLRRNTRRNARAPLAPEALPRRASVRLLTPEVRKITGHALSLCERGDFSQTP